MDGNDFLPKVKQQYEELPYPPREPELERSRLIHKIGDNLIILNHHCFNGARDFRAGFRALVAGGGTGDSTIYLAEQLRGLGGEVVYLDLSAAAMAVARERARIRGLDNICWLNESILGLPGLGLGKFDYINCTGVLHHLESSEAGLAALAGVLKDDGVILLMLYGKYGRRSVYDMQELLRQYLPADLDVAGQIRMTRELLDCLPATNSFVRDLPTWKSEISKDGFGDSGLFDLLLHSQDRCFDVPALYELADSADMEILAFVDRAACYDPFSFLPGGTVSAHLRGFDRSSLEALAEQMRSDFSAHEFYLGRGGVPGTREASLDDEANTLVMMGAMHGKHEEIGAGLTPGRTLSFTGRGGDITITGTPLNRYLLAHMDGRTPLSRIYKRATKALPGVTQAQVRGELRALYGAMHPRGYLYLLRQGSYGTRVPDYSLLQPFAE